MSKKNFINKTHIEGYIYQSSLEERVTGPNSKAPGTKYIAGVLEVATDNDMTNIVPVHFSYVTATTSKGNPNATYSVLSEIISGKYGTVMGNGADCAAKIRIDSAFGLNEFYSDRNGKEELVSNKRNEGGFVHITNVLNEDEAKRNTFECDMIITNVKEVEADEDRGTDRHAIIKGCIFNFRKELLPVDFMVTSAGGIDYFLSLEASSKNPVFTRVQGHQISTTVVKEIVEDSAFGEAAVRTTTSTKKNCVVNWAAKETYPWDSDESITVADFTEAIHNREVYLATIKQRQDEYKTQKAQGVNAFAVANSKDATFDF